MIAITLLVVWALVRRTAQLSPDDSKDAGSYVMTPEEIQAFIAVKKSIDTTYQPFINRSKWSVTSNSTFEQSTPKALKHHYPGDRYPSEGTTEADCLSHDELYIRHLRYRFQWRSAKCDLPGESGDYTITCSSKYDVRPYYDIIYSGKDMEFTHFCKDPEVCLDIDIGPSALRGVAYHDAICVDPWKLTIRQHMAIAKRVRLASSEPDWCSLPTIVPDLDFPPTWSMTTFLLTEEVTWANGSEYLAPKLYIRDSPSYYKFGIDRAYKQDTNVISTTINIGSARGKLQSKAVEFCMEMLTGGEVWTVMMFTWLKVVPRHGRILPMLLEEDENVETVGGRSRGS